ncbi:MAG: zinc ribbon domain-containing protein [Lachnospiraceae bacterium]|nr:zinc ribbon domain-containing protein [Lachnospiraceae bacterium]
MSKCNICNIEILDETDHCPLCHSILTQTDELENMYPDVRIMQKKLVLFSRIYLFAAILFDVFLISVDLHQDKSSRIWWSIIVGLILLYIYILLRYAILGKAGYKWKVILLTAIAVISAVAIDFLTGYHGWSLDYVMPSGILIMDVIIMILMYYNSRNWQSYIMWQILMILCSIIPIVLYITGIERNAYMAYLPMVVSGSLFLGTMIIGDRRAMQELKRRFHI